MAASVKLPLLKFDPGLCSGPEAVSIFCQVYIAEYLCEDFIADFSYRHSLEIHFLPCQLSFMFFILGNNKGSRVLYKNLWNTGRRT